jgi:dCTP deaminase
MAFWSGAKLRDDGPTLPIIDGFDEGQIDCSAYTLRMGAEAYVTPSHGFDLRKNKKKKLKAPEEVKAFERLIRTRGDTVVIPPGQFAFLLTEEVIQIPSNAMGFISLKSGIKFKGLINVSGFHVDPGFKGNLIYSVFNAGPSPIHIARGQDLFLLWLADLVGPHEDRFTKSGSPAQLEIPAKLISEVARETHSLQALSDRVEGLSKRVSTVTTGAVVLVAVLGLLFAFGQLSIGSNQPKNDDAASNRVENNLGKDHQESLRGSGRPSGES